MRTTTNNQQRSWGLCQKHGALLPWSTNKWCNRLLIPVYLVFPTCKPNTKRSNSKAKAEPSEASKPSSSTSTLVCSGIPRCCSQIQYHFGSKPNHMKGLDLAALCMAKFCAGGEPVSATSLVRAPLKHLGLHTSVNPKNVDGIAVKRIAPLFWTIPLPLNGSHDAETIDWLTILLRLLFSWEIKTWTSLTSYLCIPSAACPETSQFCQAMVHLCPSSQKSPCQSHPCENLKCWQGPASSIQVLARGINWAKVAVKAFSF